MLKDKLSVSLQALQTVLLFSICFALFGKGVFKISQVSAEEAIIKTVGSKKIHFEPTNLLPYDSEQWRIDSIRESRTNINPSHEYD